MSETTRKEVCCSLGRRCDIGGINAALRSGMSVREVAKTFGVGKTVVSDHRAECLKLEAVKKAAPSVSAAEPPKEAEAADSPDSVRGQSGQPTVAPRARLPTEAKDAKTFVEQSLVCADMVASGKWEGRASVRWLSALWGISIEAVRERHRAGVVAAEADRGHIEAERQVAIGALQEQERIALEAFEASKGVVDEEGQLLFSAGDPRLLAIAQKARAEIARIAGCIPQGTTVNVNVETDPKFRAAAQRFVDVVQDVLGAPEELAERLARLGTPVPSDIIAQVLAAADASIAERLRPRPPPALEAA